MRTTGGRASGATSTRSRSRFRASVSASGRALMPSWDPSGDMTRTSRARIRSLIRGSRLLSAMASSLHRGAGSFWLAHGGTRPARGTSANHRCLPAFRSTVRNPSSSARSGTVGPRPSCSPILKHNPESGLHCFSCSPSRWTNPICRLLRASASIFSPSPSRPLRFTTRAFSASMANLV